MKFKLLIPIISVLCGLGLSGCTGDSSTTSNNSSSSSNIEFNSQNYSLEITAKDEYTPQNISENTRNIKRANTRNISAGNYSWNEDSLVITLDSQDISYLETLDPDIGPNAEPRVNGRLLTAPSDATVVEVTGINLLDSSEVIAPQQWQLIEIDDNGIYPSNTLDLSENYEGIIQPRSIKTTNLTLESGFSIDRKNVYFINGENNNCITPETACKFASFTITKDELCELLISTIVNIYVDRNYTDYFSVTLLNTNNISCESPESVGIPQEAMFTISSTNGEFTYAGSFWFELYDDQPADVYCDGQKITDTSNLGLTKYANYFIQNATYYYTDNTYRYIEEILEEHYEFKTPTGIQGEIQDIQFHKSSNYYYPVITIKSENRYAPLIIEDTGDKFYDINTLFPYGDGTFTYYLKTDDYSYGKPYLVINGFDLASGYNPLAHDFDLFFDGDYHDVKVNLGNLGETNGDYEYPVKGIDGNLWTNIYQTGTIQTEIRKGNFKNNFHIDYRGCIYDGSDSVVDDNLNNNFSKSYIILTDIINEYYARNNCSYTAFIFMTKDQITLDSPKDTNDLIILGLNFYTSGSREDLENLYSDGYPVMSPISISDIPDDHFNTTPEYMLSQMNLN